MLLIARCCYYLRRSQRNGNRSQLSTSMQITPSSIPRAAIVAAVVAFIRPMFDEAASAHADYDSNDAVVLT